MTVSNFVAICQLLTIVR